MLIRSMREGDCKAVAGLLQDCFTDPWSETAVRDMFAAERYINLVAETEGRICGYLGILRVLDEADVMNIAVAPCCRRQGIAGKLLRTIFSAADIRRLYLEVRISNEGAAALYKKEGFEVYGQRKNYYNNPPEDALLMRWQKPGSGNDFQ